MSDSEKLSDANPEDSQEREPFQEITPSGRVRTRRRAHSGPYNAPIPEAADLQSMRLHPLPEQEAAARQAAKGNSTLAGDPAKIEELVRRVAAELQREAGVEETATPEARPHGEFSGPPSMPHGQHPADQIPPPLPPGVASLNRLHEFEERSGKRKRKRGEDGVHGGRRKCPFCQKHRALHIRPSNPLVRAMSLLGIRTYSCRNCHNKFLAFAFVEGPYFTWKQLGIFALIVLLLIVGALVVSPMFNRIPDLVDP